jgi:hypothetical protein
MQANMSANNEANAQKMRTTALPRGNGRDASSEVQSAADQPFLWAFTRTAGPDEASAGRLILLVICQRCSSMVVPGWPCWHCANLNINALAIDRAREPGTGSLPVRSSGSRCNPTSPPPWNSEALFHRLIRTGHGTTRRIEERQRLERRAGPRGSVAGQSRRPAGVILRGAP